MAQLKNSVGDGGINAMDDVQAVKIALNQRVHMIGMPMLVSGGVYTPSIAHTLRRFQSLVLRIEANGMVEPGDQTARALFGTPAGAQIAAAQEGMSNLSGAEWWSANQARFPDHHEISELAPAFSQRAGEFIGALRRAGANVRVSSTKRSRQRAYLRYYSWQIATGSMLANEVPVDEDIGIIWDHGDPIWSRDAAQQMVELFKIVKRPSLTSNHVTGTAIDMEIDWTRPLHVRDAKGNAKLLDRPRSAATNEVLHDIGRSYGVRKLQADTPHWSEDGR